jgi:tetratricopeptide (TPR) repeat protein
VIIFVKLNRLTGKLALLIPLLLASGLLLYLIRSHFLIRQMSDVRYEFQSEALAAAVNLLPRSGRLNLELAQALLREKADFASALPYAERAVQLSPTKTSGWQTLGQAQEGVGQPEAAEASLRRAVALAPRNSDANWALANLLLRLGRVGDSLPFLAVAGEMNASLYPGAYDVLWQITDKQLPPLRTVAGNKYAAQMALLNFLAEQGLFEEAAQLFKSVDHAKASQDHVTAQFINTLIQRRQIALAHTTWLELVGKGKLPEGEAIWNGGFEMDLVRPLSHFDWNLSESKFARCALESGRGRNGSKAVKVGFLGKDTTVLSSEVFQLVVLKPGAQYRLEAFAKAANLISPEGPRLAIKKGGEILATSSPVASGSGAWQHLRVEFVAPSEPAAMSVAIVRVPKYAYDEPTSGTIWFDDFSLREQ